MAAILTPRVVRRMAGECTDVDERGAVGIRLEPAAAIDENQDGTRGSNLLRSSAESANRGPRGSQGWQTGGRRRYDKDRTGKALVGRDDGLALRIMSGDDAAYFECHGFPP